MPGSYHRCFCFLFILPIAQVQTKYLGRNWRKNNMKTISAIYRRVRHHLHDDWAYGNDLDAKPWDFQQQVSIRERERERERSICIMIHKNILLPENLVYMYNHVPASLLYRSLP